MKQDVLNMLLKITDFKVDCLKIVHFDSIFALC